MCAEKKVSPGEARAKKIEGTHAEDKRQKGKEALPLLPDAFGVSPRERMLIQL